MKTKINCSCNCTESYIILSCSGASDLGELTDKASRIIRNELPNISMNCLSKLGFGDQSLIETINKEQALVIDGCPIDCGKKLMEKNGISLYKHFRLTDLGLKKGESPVNEYNTQLVVEKIKCFLE